jgi:apolipoprotein N-acyltransferase
MKHHHHQGLRGGGHSLKDWLTIRFRPFLLPIAAGALAGLALPPLGWPWLLWLALVPLWSCGARGGALWGGFAVLLSHRWLLALHPLDWVGVPSLLSLPLALLLLGICAGAGAALVATWCVLVQRLEPRRWSTALLASVLWGLMELLLAKGPLFWIGLSAVVLPGDRLLAALAQIGGPPLLTALQLVLAWLLWRRRWALFVLLLVLSHGLGGWLLSQTVPAAGAGQPLQLVSVQPALPTREKFSVAQQLQQRRLLQQGFFVAAAQAADAVVLPEGSLPLGETLQPPAAVELLSGGFRRVGPEERSSVLWFPADASKHRRGLDKHRLVPLGEWVPGGYWSGLSAVGGLTPGDADRLLALPPPLGPLAVAICYELSDAEALARAIRGGADWILTVANLDPYPAQLQQQFLMQAQLRALESRRWLLSVANTGPTAVINPRGQQLQALVPNRPQLGLMQLWRRGDRTLWVRWGASPSLLVLAGAVLWRLLARPLRAT